MTRSAPLSVSLSQVFQACEVVLAFRGAFAPRGIAAIFQVVAGMIKVDNFDWGLGRRRQMGFDVVHEPPIVFRPIRQVHPA